MMVTNHATLFTGLTYVEYTLQWAIFTVGDTTFDNVSVTIGSCCFPIIDSRNGNNDETIAIYDKCWMAENLAPTCRR